MADWFPWAEVALAFRKLGLVPIAFQTLISIVPLLKLLNDPEITK